MEVVRIKYRPANRTQRREMEKEVHNNCKPYYGVNTTFLSYLFLTPEWVTYNDLYSEFLLVSNRITDHLVLQKRFVYTVPNPTWFHDAYKPIEVPYKGGVIQKIRDAYFGRNDKRNQRRG
jgi:hypothetical protein